MKGSNPKRKKSSSYIREYVEWISNKIGDPFKETYAKRERLYFA